MIGNSGDGILHHKNYFQKQNREREREIRKEKILCHNSFLIGVIVFF
jgi:hypothetical protein